MSARFGPPTTRIAAPDRYLSLDGTAGCYASTPHSATFAVTGDLDVRIELLMTDFTPSALQVLVAKQGANPNLGWQWYVRSSTAGAMTLNASSTGTSQLTATSSAANSLTDNTRGWLRVVRKQSNSSGTFYQSTDGSNWTGVGVADAGATTGSTLFDNSTVAVTVGGNPAANLTARVYSVQIRDGIDGTLVANPDFTKLAPGTTSFRDAQDNVWTLNGTAVLV